MNILTVMHEIQSAFLGVTLQCRCFLQSPPRKKRRSNPAIKIIIPERLGVPRGIEVIDLLVPFENGPITGLSSDEGDGVELCQF
jgi:hypothetical protein